MVRRLRRSLLVRGAFALLVLASLLTVAPVPESRAQVQGTLVYATRVEPRCVDPANQVDQQTLKVVRNAYEPLVEEIQGTLRLGPSLATRWQISPDAKTYTFTLRPGVKFADGSDLTPQSVKFSYDRIKAGGLAVGSILNDLDRVEVVNQTTVRIVLAQPDVYFLYKVAKVGIVNDKVATQRAEGNDMGQRWLCRNTAGSGPYQLAEWQPAQFIMLRRNPHYWRGWNGKHIDAIRLAFVPENVTQLQMLERLEIDMNTTAFVNDIERLRQNRGLRVILAPAIETDIFTMNSARGALTDTRVRQAISLAFDYNAQAFNVWRRLGVLPRGFMPQGLECFNKTISPQRQDMARARELLQQANATNIRLALAFTAGREDMKQAAAILQDNLRQLGPQLEVREIPWPTLFEMHKRADSAPNFGTLIMGAFTGDPASYLELNFHSRNIERPYNWSFWKNAEFDKLVDDAKQTLDKPKRCEMLGRAQKILVDEAPALYVASPPKVETLRTRVKGYLPHPIDYYWSTRFYQMWLEQ
ncbi:MAG: ABC transporter substrate-binding protein [Armatimonadetes bacterium]|nr:ABC transporter substrate-binding protein [Armatimonadota bacterium]